MLIHCLLNKSQKNEQKAQAKAYRLEILMTNSIWAESILPTPSPRQLRKRWLCWLSPSHCRHNHPHCCHRIHRLLLLPQMPSPSVSAARVGNGEELSTPPPPRVAITATVTTADADANIHCHAPGVDSTHPRGALPFDHRCSLVIETRLVAA